MPLQSWIFHWQEGPGARMLRVGAALLGFVVLAAFYDLFSYDGFSSEEAMENAQLARNISSGNGYTTDSIRPLALYMLADAAEAGQSSKVLAEPLVPDVSVAPGYPLLLAGLMKGLPFHFTPTDFRYFQPERWISIFNQALFFLTVLLLFAVARRLFDAKVAWLAAALFAGTELFWRFSISGLSTILLMLIFLAVVALLAGMEKRDRAATEGVGWKSVPAALLAGLLLGAGGLSRYAFGWLVLPVLAFVWINMGRGRGKLCLTILLSFAAVMGPWVARNIRLSGHSFGTAGYAVLQETAPFPGDTLERSADPRNGMKHLLPMDIVDKFLVNLWEVCADDLPKMGGNWIVAFFLTGLLVPYRNPGLSRFRWFMVGSLVLLMLVQALGKTHISSDRPQINSENLLVLLTPVVFIYGVALFHSVLDQLNLPPWDGRSMAMAGCLLVFCAPFLFALMAPHYPPANSPYSPLHIQRISHLLETNELMVSDIPSGVAWYGGRSCVWLPLDDDREYSKVNALKPIHGLFLTQVTTDKRFLSQMELDEKSWGHFVLECAEHGEVPTGFALKKGPGGLLPEQLFLTDEAGWRETGKSP